MHIENPSCIYTKVTTPFWKLYRKSILRKFSDAIPSPQPLKCSKTIFTITFHQELYLPLNRQTVNNTSDASPIVGVTAELLHIMSQLSNNVVFCLTEAPPYQPHLRRFFLINLGDVFSYQSLRLDRQCMLLMGRILAFSFLHRVFLHFTSSFRGEQLHQLLVNFPAFLCMFICFDFFHRKMCSEVVSSLKTKLRVIQTRRAHTKSVVFKEKNSSQAGQFGSRGFSEVPLPLHETAVRISELLKLKARKQDFEFISILSYRLHKSLNPTSLWN